VKKESRTTNRLIVGALLIVLALSTVVGQGGRGRDNPNSPKPTNPPSPRPRVRVPRTGGNASKRLSEPKILWTSKCDPRTSANYCNISKDPGILNEFYDAVKSVKGTLTYHVPDSKQELARYTVVIVDFCPGAANDNSLNAVKQFIQEGGSAFIMGGNFCKSAKHFTSWWASQLTRDFGVTFTSDDDVNNPWVDAMAMHPTTLDVKKIYVHRHVYLNVVSPSQSILTISGRPISAIYDGTGTFVAFSSETFEWGGVHRPEIASSDNFVFWQNALKWLISRSQDKRLKLRKTSSIMTSQPIKGAALSTN
jgi:hypothetical protein